MPGEYLTIPEAAARLKVKPKTVREWLRTGQMKGLKAGRLWRITEDDLQAFLRRGRAQETQDTPAEGL
jgi:excisionase family DNA binding protein